MPLPSTLPRRRAITGSAVRVIPGKTATYMARNELPWQRQALMLYDLVPELHYSGQFYARMLSKVKFFPALQNPDGSLEQIKEGPPVEALDRIQDAGGGRSQMLFRYGQLSFITGESYLVGKGVTDGPGYWTHMWRDELKFSDDGKVTHLLAPGFPQEVLTQIPDSAYETVSEGDVIAYRVWTPHPRFSGWADSPMRGVLDVAEELLILTKAVHATATSRLTNGAILVPQEIAPPPVEPLGDEDPENDPFLTEMIEHLEGQIENPSDPAARVPYLWFAGYDYLDRIRKVDFHDPQTDYLERDLRKEAVQRLGYGLDLPPEVLMGFAQANHWCLVSEAEIYTRERGFIHHSLLREGDVVRTLDTRTGLAEWEPVQDIYRAEVSDLPMIEIESRDHHSLSTLNHRWPVIRDGQIIWTTAEELLHDDRLIRGAAGSDLPEEAVYPDAFVEAVAWFITEGTATWPSLTYCQVKISQSHKANPALVAKIRQALTRLWGPAQPTLLGAHAVGAAIAPAWREKREQRGMTLFHLNSAARDQVLDAMESRRSKVVKREFVFALTSAQLELFLGTCAIGDGTLRSGGGMVIDQRDKRRLEPIALAAILAGRGITWKTRMSGGFTEKRNQHLLCIHAPTRGYTRIADRARAVTYTGTIWCPVTGNQSWLARQDGKVFFTGNTGFVINDNLWNDHGDPKARQWANDVNEVYLRPALRDEFEFSDWEKVVIGYDAGAVVVNPDRSDDANEAWDRGAIGYTGFRKMKTIPEEYQQTAEEHQEWLETKLVRIRETQQKAVDATPVPGEGPPPSGPANVATKEPKLGSANGNGAVRELGAVEMAMLNCRRVAGIRLRSNQYTRKHPNLVLLADGQPPELVAAVVGQERIVQHEIDARELVRGGTDSFRTLLSFWGYKDSAADVLCDMLERYSASTLCDRDLPEVPASFVAHLERSKEML